jgi:hypothetical protein
MIKKFHIYFTQIKQSKNITDQLSYKVKGMTYFIKTQFNQMNSKI